MISLREKLKLNKFDWEDFLARAVSGNATEAELSQAKTYSQDWRRCPAGELPAILPRESDFGGGLKEPTDHKLYELGIEFSWAIGIENWKDASKYLKQINKLGAELVDKEIVRMIEALAEIGYDVIAP
jgi:hypothetical protein